MSAVLSEGGKDIAFYVNYLALVSHSTLLKGFVLAPSFIT
jgi:hypothetical protein